MKNIIASSIIMTAMFAPAVSADAIAVRAVFDGQITQGVVLKVKPDIGDVFRSQVGNCYEVVDAVWEAYSAGNPSAFSDVYVAGTVTAESISCID